MLIKCELFACRVCLFAFPIITTPVKVDGKSMEQMEGQIEIHLSALMSLSLCVENIVHDNTSFYRDEYSSHTKTVTFLCKKSVAPTHHSLIAFFLHSYIFCRTLTTATKCLVIL